MATRTEGQPIHSSSLEHLATLARDTLVRVRRHWRSLSIVAAALGVGGYLFITHDRGPQNPPVVASSGVSDIPKPPDYELVVPLNTPEMDSAPAISPPPPEPTPTPTPEVVQEQPCSILPDEYCSQAEVIDWTNPSGMKSKIIGIALPAGVPLLMPKDGQVAKVKLRDDGVFKGFQAQVFNPKEPNKWYIFVGDLQFDNMFSLNMKKGETFGRTQKTGIENAGKYNLLFYIVTGAGRDAFIAEDEMKGMFPGAFAKPTTEAAAPKGATSGTIHITTFYDAPPK